MCYTIKIDLTREQIEKRFRAIFSQPELYSPGDKINAFVLPAVPVISNQNPDQISLYNWGLIPFWVKDADTADALRRRTFNAKSETLAEKPSYRGSFGKKHCLVLTTGFYEWQTIGKEKIPYIMGLKDQQAFALAGLYDNWKDPATGKIVNTFTVITTRANPRMEVIHNLKKRMPVIISPADEQKWLSADLNTSEIQAVFEPYPQELMTFEKIEKRL
ncbi:MAG: SOS response-associated peptidase [Bacteroidales bacterium]|nr:SOS response-associated peptidase [Bacteroidales bacterium]